MVDVDGTLMPAQRNALPSKKVREAIEKASHKIHIGVATSRPYFMLAHVFDHLKLFGPSIINGGSQVMDIPSQKILWEKYIEKNDYGKIKKILLQQKVHFFLHDEDKDLEYIENYTPTKLFNVVVIGLTPKKSDIVLEQLSQIPTIAAHKVSSFQKNKNDIIVSHASATKQHGIFEVAKLLNIETHEIIGVGDGYNDFPLLMACGLKVAMGNAVDDLKAIADYIAPTVEDDGVADVIEKFILKR